MPSFFYPPKFATVDEVFDFFTTVEIPDRVLNRVITTYYKARVEVDDPTLATTAWDQVMAQAWDFYNPRPLDDAPAPSATVIAPQGRMSVHDARRDDAKTQFEQTMRQRLEERDADPHVYLAEPLMRLVAIYDTLRCAGQEGLNSLPAEDLFAGLMRPVEFNGTTGPLAEQVWATGVAYYSEWCRKESNYTLDFNAPLLVSQIAEQVTAQVAEQVRTITTQVVEQRMSEHEGALDAAFDELWQHVGEIGDAIVLNASIPHMSRKQMRAFLKEN